MHVFREESDPPGALCPTRALFASERVKLVIGSLSTNQPSPLMTHTVAAPSKGPIIAFVVVLLVGILIALPFLAKLFSSSQDLAEPKDDPQEQAVASVTPPAMTPSTANAGVDTKSMPATPKPELDADAYTTDSVLVTDLANALKAGDLAKFIELAGQGALPEGTVTQLRALLDGGFTLDPNETIAQDPSASNGNASRWVINLLPPTNLKPVGRQSVRLDLAKDPAQGWEVRTVSAPDLKSLVAQMKAKQEREPLRIAGEFLDAVIARDFAKAKTYVNSDKLSEEKLAALFIVVEEGGFQKRAEKPLVPTIVQETAAWVIARLQSTDRKSEFGIEMARIQDAWKVDTLNFDQLMMTVAKESGAGEIAYAELVTELNSGDSLVLFFEFDADQVNARAQKQLEILAGILKQDPKRVLHINGHADAKGDETYNEQLSNSRAFNVRSTLVELGVPDAQLKTRAFGESAPKAPNLNPDGTDNPSGRAQNRRAEVYLQF